MSVTRSTIIGSATEIAKGTFGTPRRLSFENCFGMSPSRDIIKSRPNWAATAVFTALSRRRAKTTPTTSPKICPKAFPKAMAPYCSAMKRRVSSLRSTICGASDSGSESIAQPRRNVPRLTSMATGMIALADVFPMRGLSSGEPLSGFIVPVRLAIASTPLRARITPTKETQIWLQFPSSGFRF